MLGRSQKISNSSPGRSSPADPDQIKKLLASPEGQALIQLLQADGGAGIRAASAAIQSGDMEGAKAALSPLLAGTGAETLTQKLEEQL